jgi:PAS domain-containing protein
MLECAIATGSVQHVLSPFQIAQTLAEPPTLEYAMASLTAAPRPKTREQLEQENRELARTNRELLGVHGELQRRVAELQTALLYAQFHASGLVQAHAAVSSLLSGASIALIELDANLRVQGYSGDVSQLYGLTPGDIGKPLAQLEHRAQHMPALPPCLELLHASQAAQLDEADVVTADRWYIRRILPRALHVQGSHDRAVDPTGAVLVFIDVTKLKDSEAWAEGLEMSGADTLQPAQTASASRVSPTATPTITRPTTHGATRPASTVTESAPSMISFAAASSAGPV